MWKQLVAESCFSFFFFKFIFGPHCTACGTLVLWPKSEPTPPAVEAWSPNHWTTREAPGSFQKSNFPPTVPRPAGRPRVPQACSVASLGHCPLYLCREPLWPNLCLQGNGGSGSTLSSPRPVGLPGGFPPKETKTAHQPPKSNAQKTLFFGLPWWRSG